MMANSRIKDGHRRFTDILKGQSTAFRARWRKIVTGSEKKRIRDHVQETPEYVKFGDKLAFTLGFLNILACEYFLVAIPHRFWMWYAAVVPLLLITRTAYFFRLRWHYFLLDFCYFVLLCSFLNLFVLWESDTLFRVVYIFTHGPLTWAIVVWRNSLVFHDYDKITSVYIHLLPCLLYYCARWHGCSPMSTSSRLGWSSATAAPPNSFAALEFGSAGGAGGVGSVHSGVCTVQYPRMPPEDTLHWMDFVLAAIGYIFWQICYFAKTEIVDRRKLDEQPTLLTSLRWLSADRKNSFARMVVGICRKIGVYGREEHPDSATLKTKLVFMSAQFLYTVMTFMPTILLYRSQRWNAVYLVFIFSNAAFNGASFYIEVFSKVYQKKISRLDEMRGVAEAAAQFSLDVSRQDAGTDGVSGESPGTWSGGKGTDREEEKNTDDSSYPDDDVLLEDVSPSSESSSD